MPVSALSFPRAFGKSNLRPDLTDLSFPSAVLEDIAAEAAFGLG